MLAILESIQGAYGYIPVAAVKRVSQVSGAPYALIYGTATYYSHLHFEKPGHSVAVCRCTACLMAGANRIARSLGRALGTEIGQPPAGGVALEQLSSHIPGAASPLVTLDGKPQPHLTPARAATLGRTLAGGTAGMTVATVLATPARWPRFLLPEPPAADPANLTAAVEAGAFAGLRAAVEELRPDGVIAAIVDVRSARPRWRRHGDRREVARLRRGRGRSPLRGRQRLPGGPGRADGPDPARDEPLRGPGGRRHRRLHRGRDRGRGGRPGRGGGRDPGPASPPSPRPSRPAIWAPSVLGSGTEINVSVKPLAGRLHARRGDGPAQGSRGQARPARAATALHHDPRPVRQADPDPRPADLRGRAVHPDRRGRTASPRSALRRAAAPSWSRSPAQWRRPVSPRSRSASRSARSWTWPAAFRRRVA